MRAGGYIPSAFVAALRALQGDRGVTGGAAADPDHPSRKHDIPGLVPSWAAASAPRPPSSRAPRRERRPQMIRRARVLRDIAREAARDD